MNIPKRLSVKALVKIFNNGGFEAVEDMMSSKPDSGPTFQKAIDELKSSGKDVMALQELHDTSYKKEEKEYVQTYDRTIFGNKEEIAALVEVQRSGWNAAKVYQVIRKFELEPAMCMRVPGSRGKGTYVYRLQDIYDAIDQFIEDKSVEFLSEKPDDMVTPADILEMLPEAWSMTNTSYCGSLVKFCGIKEQGKYRAVGGKGKGSSLYLESDVRRAIAGITAIRQGAA